MPIDIGWDDGAVFNFSNSLTGAIELKFDAYKAGQVIDIYGYWKLNNNPLELLQEHLLLIKLVVDYDGASSNLIQIVMY